MRPMPDAGVEITGCRVQHGSVPGGALRAKWSTAKRVFRQHGARGILEVLKAKASTLVTFRPDLRTAIRVWFQQEHWWVGLIVALRGNVVKLDSCVFRVSHPAIATATKSLFFFGTYERPEREIVKKYLNRTHPVVELGGSIGIVACVTNRLLNDRRKHVVVEANPDLIDVLVENRDRNGCHFTVLHRALAYGGNETVFYTSPGAFLAGSVQVESSTPVAVRTVSLRGILDEYRFDACTLVCDIEGGEMDLVEHEIRVLQERVELLIVEVHGWRVGQHRAEQMIRALECGGFRRIHEREGTYVFRNDRLAPGTN